ncbi:hydroxymethylbilane synthase [Desulfonatronospira sp.]|uniref:hydroxymethylbilane synthase n=1 Tax=Desulfonatronospira sp. TaxID=1962951 RepID=UPI0025BB76F4|nr:hydroxymethylbilane synthase [Desulfonatronospira sp.]
MKKITIATRGSKLALWQAEHISARLKERYSGLEVELLKVKTTGDKILDVPLAKVGGKGLFVKEIEEALLDGRADIAVHSMKDMPAQLPEGLKLGIIPERESRFDVLLSKSHPDISSLPTGASVGTSSLRRQAQILHLRPDLEIQMLRGNLDTRLRKLNDGVYDAIIVAAAGMSRLNLQTRYFTELAPPYFLPAVGQGALGIEYQQERVDLDELLGFMDDFSTRCCVECERAFLAELEGGCQVPIACYCTHEDNSIQATGLVCDLMGERMIRKSVSGKPKDARSLGVDMARQILEAGGRQILAELYACHDNSQD